MLITSWKGYGGRLMKMQSELRVLLLVSCLATGVSAAEQPSVDFNRVRAILSSQCFTCHGPDPAERQGDLRLDIPNTVGDQAGSHSVLTPGKPLAGELLRRIQSTDPDERMPPVDFGQGVSAEELDILKQWIESGAEYKRHWSYAAPTKPDTTKLEKSKWMRNEIDTFVLARMKTQGLKPNSEADRYALIRRLSLDLTGLPPTLQEVDAFVTDSSKQAYENLVDRLLASNKYGERWAAMWLDLARYADSAGYANDPQRTIWLYRDWVINAFNTNMPFDQFTIEQIGGDLLEDASEQNIVATAFHRNTLTQSEGGTNDEEFRNSAVVDRVNTTMQVWMGTTIRCAQCHNHKYDPISQEEYFKFFAFFNNTEDADRADEQPLLSLFTAVQKESKSRLQDELESWKGKTQPSVKQLAEQLASWRSASNEEVQWQGLIPTTQKSTSGKTELTVSSDGVINSSGETQTTESYELTFSSLPKSITAIRLEALTAEVLPAGGPGRAGNGNFVLTELSASVGAPADEAPVGKIVRIDLPGKQKMIHVAEIEVFSKGSNIALQGVAKQSSTGFGGEVKRANDGNTDGRYDAGSVTHTEIEDNPWIEIELKEAMAIDSISIWNRTDNNVQKRLDGFEISILDAQRDLVWKKVFAKAPDKNVDVEISGLLPVVFASASATFEQRESGKIGQFSVEKAIDGDRTHVSAGWAVGGEIGQDNIAVFVIKKPLKPKLDTTLKLTLSQSYPNHPLGKFRISVTGSTGNVAVLPKSISVLGDRSWDQLEVLEQDLVREYYQRNIPPDAAVTKKVAELEKAITDMRPTTVPVMKELTGKKRRKTNIQLRGNFEVIEGEVTEGTPSAFHPFPDDASRNRLELARWLVAAENPLTGRVVVNRYWEQLFGQGIVGTSEEFGIQGAMPTHPQLLDWLAVTFTKDYAWDVKRLLKTIVMSATYRQSAEVTTDHNEIDPFNLYLARGPRFRLSAEMIRDQALSVSGLLSDKMYGPSVRPPRPQLGLKAAFGGSTDWATSDGEDKFRRGVYTQWRRSLPYPSMATFDAPNRNVCTISRGRTNTPLQALVTLNDPVYIETAQSLARRIIAEGGNSIESQAIYGFRLVLARPPYEAERKRIIALYERVAKQYADDPRSAQDIATVPIGPLTEGVDMISAAAWTVVGNVLLNLDETLAKR
jgi:mono/diheme cytochrome c family protein